MLRVCPYNCKMEYLFRYKYLITSYGNGFRVSKPGPGKLGFRLKEGASCDIDQWSLIKSGAS
jgi:hypothetical protein